MKKLIASLVAIMILVCGCTAAFAEQKALTGEEALQAALGQVGLNEKEVTVTKTEMNRVDGNQLWDIEFNNANTKYEFVIDALTGNILVRLSSRIHSRVSDGNNIRVFA